MDAHESRKKEIQLEFNKYDKDGSGSVSLAEAHEILKDKLGLTSEGTDKLIKACDTNGDGQLSYNEFVEFYFMVNNRVAEMKETFASFDKSGNGSVSVEEAVTVLSQYGFSEQCVKRLIAQNDANEDGELQYEEFVKFWNAD